MALIPADVGVRMRLPGDALQAPAPIAGLPTDLPDLQPGQIFSARIQDVLPENTYRALVAGKSLTLALPEGAKAGDILELVVIDRTPRAIVARSTTPEAGAQTEAYQHTTLSPTAQLIGRLLSERQPAQTAPLNRGQPLLSAAPTTGLNTAQLATALHQSVDQSGMFYEAHQAQWIAGRRPLATLLQEPQGQLSQPQAYAHAAIELSQRDPLIQSSRDLIAATLAGKAEDKAVVTDTPAPIVKTDVQAMPDELRPLVHQQLEAAGNQRLIWHGEVWPGQQMEWQIEQDKNHQPSSPDEAAPWQTTMRLTTPRLGSVEARLRISGNSLQLNLITPTGATAADLRDELPSLNDALAAAGINLQTAQVRHEPN